MYMLLSRTLTDLSLSTSAAKCYYHRTRPFAQNKKPLCTPDEKAALEKNGSYPSGHTAIGWGWALILSEISPEQTDAILARGRAFGESRIVCNVHWYSDVVQSRLIAAGTVARLHDDPAFLADLEAAKADALRSRASYRPSRIGSEPLTPPCPPQQSVFQFCSTTHEIHLHRWFFCLPTISVRGTNLNQRNVSWMRPDQQSRTAVKEANRSL